MQEDLPNTTEADTPPAEAPEPQEAEVPASSDTTTLILAGPFYQTSLSFTRDDGSTLVIDRNGTAVPNQDVDKIMASATNQGVTLTRKEY